MIKSSFDSLKLYQYYQSYHHKLIDYVLLGFDDFNEKIIHNKLVFVSDDQGINGFISGVYLEDKFYVSLVCGEHLIQEQLIMALEDHLILKNIKSIWIHFFNPVNLAWYPKKNVTHPGVQGLVYNGQLHQIYTKLGYQDHSIQDTYYQDLKDFIKKDTSVKQASHIEFYDYKKHKGLSEFAHKIGVKDWTNTILLNQEKDKPLPLLLALNKGKIIGFTGPLFKEDSGRGYFAGIGLLKEYRGQGFGKALFYRLCQELYDIGADYMTFFTGRNNPAKYIYMSSGFKVVKSFVTMKKILREAR